MQLNSYRPTIKPEELGKKKKKKSVLIEYDADKNLEVKIVSYLSRRALKEAQLLQKLV